MNVCVLYPTRLLESTSWAKSSLSNRLGLRELRGVDLELVTPGLLGAISSAGGDAQIAHLTPSDRPSEWLERVAFTQLLEAPRGGRTSLVVSWFGLP